MDGEHGGEVPEKWPVTVAGAQVDDGQRRVPVVRVEDLRVGCDLGQRGDGGEREEREAPRVVGIVGAVPV